MGGEAEPYYCPEHGRQPFHPDGCQAKTGRRFPLCGRPLLRSSPGSGENEGGERSSFAEIDAAELLDAGADPKVQRLHEAADAHLAKLREQGRIAPENEGKA